MRVLDRLLALIVGLALVAAGGLALAEILWAIIGRPPLVVPRTDLNGTLSTLTWQDPQVQAVAAALIAIGLLLLILQFIPRTPIAYDLQDGNADRDISIDRRGLQERLRRLVLDDRDVVDASVKLSKKKAQVKASVLPDADRGQARSRLNDTVTNEFAALGMAKPLRPDISAVQARERVR